LSWDRRYRCDRCPLSHAQDRRIYEGGGWNRLWRLSQSCLINMVYRWLIDEMRNLRSNTAICLYGTGWILSIRPRVRQGVLARWLRGGWQRRGYRDVSDRDSFNMICVESMAGRWKQNCGEGKLDLANSAMCLTIFQSQCGRLRVDTFDHTIDDGIWRVQQRDRHRKPNETRGHDEEARGLYRAQR
jgi:hypothetical protein